MNRKTIKGSGLCLLTSLFSIVLQCEQSFAENVTALGTATVTTTIKRELSDCELIDKCEVGRPCFSNITIEGQSAKQLYDGLKLHGTKYNDAFASDYVGTQSDDLTCWNDGGKYTCYIGYDGAKNEISDSPFCDPE